MLASNLYAAEQMIANAILNASGTYISPVFGELNKPYYSGNYYSYRSFTSAGRYFSNQVWSGTNGVVMEGDPIIVEGRNDLSGGSGNDVLYGSTGTTAFIYGLGGNDIIIGPEDLMASGGDGNDFIIGGLTVNGRGSGNYLIEWQKRLANYSSLSSDELHKLFNYSDGQSTMYGDAGNDTLVALNDRNHQLYGDDTMENSGSGKDLIIAGDGDNYVNGGGGNDTIIVGDGNNSVYGGSGDDTIIVGDGENTIYGGSGNDYIEVGDNFYSSIDAGSGDDTIVLSGAIETLDGGEGNDIVSFEYSSTGLDIYLNNLYNVETVIATYYDDIMVGTASDDYFDGLAGNDSLRGGAGNDTILGNSGNDTIRGENGNDYLYGGTGNDAIYGDNGNDALVGGDGNDILFGGAGDDDLYGGTGNDMIYGGDGSDFYYLEKDFGFDQVFENANQGTDDRIIFQYLTMSDVIYGRSGNDLMFGNSDQSNVVAIVDWFENFGIDSFWFTTGTANQYNYVTAAQIAELFGVEIPADVAASSDLAMASSNELNVSQAAMATAYEMVGGASLADLAIEVTGLDQMPVDMFAAC